MKILTSVSKVALLCALFCGNSAMAQDGAPHTLVAESNYSTVDLSWKAPADDIKLQWHDDNDYNGIDGLQSNPEGMSKVYVASKFSASDLASVAGQTIDSIAYFRYSNVYSVNVMIYENGKVVRDQEVDLSDFVKNSWKKVGLKEPYIIPEGAEIMIALKIVNGNNLSFVAIMDKAGTRGKGDLFSYDGTKWQTGAGGDFLITAYIKNNAAEAVSTGYNVYRDGVKVNTELLTETSYKLENEAVGTHEYKVSAVYATEEKMSSEVSATSVSTSSLYPAVATLTGTVEDLKGTLTWQSPLQRKDEMTWSSKTLGYSIGGTSTTSPKVWIKQEFDSNDMLAYPSHQIKAINAYIAEKVMNSVTLFVMKNGVIDYSEVVSADVVSAIEAGAWAKFTLATPYVMELGNTYSYGCYYTHTASAHPVGVDSSDAVSVKGNSFSTSSPSSTFKSSKPSWKTLASGNLTGNFMLTADVEAVGEVEPAAEVDSYDVYREDDIIAADVKANTYTDEVADLGTYTYSVVAKGKDGKKSFKISKDLTFTLPEIYTAPLVTEATFDEETKELGISWSSDAVELKHYGTATYVAGFNEAMDLLYGSKFTAEELKNVAGYEIKTLKFGVGASIDAFKLEIYAGADKLYSQSIEGSDVTPGALYSLNLETPVTIPADKDVYLVYNASLPASVNAMILDGGPAIENGAVISLTDGAKWLNLSTISSDYKNLNIVIGAVALPASAKKSRSKESVTLEKRIGNTNAMNSIVIKKVDVEEAAKTGFGVAPDVQPDAVETVTAVAKTAVSAPKVKCYNVYRNNELMEQTDATSYTEILKDYGEFNYYITSVYDNGWESKSSKVVPVENFIPQKAEAPYNLEGEAEGGNLKLTWSDASADNEMTYMTGDTDLAIGMTGTGTRESYIAYKFTADDLAKAGRVGQRITHVKFKLASTDLATAAVIVIAGDNIVFEQPIEVSELKVGWNTIRLNEPVVVAAGKEFGYGYHITYASGIKPIVCDAGPAVSGYGDLISASASSGYWYSLKTKFNLDYNWRISGVFMKADQELKLKSILKGDAVATTYNVYCDGSVIANGVTTKEYTVNSANSGKYTVTSVTDGVESAESNAVDYAASVGVNGVNEASKAYYSQAAQMVMMPKAASARVYAVNGALVKAVENVENIDMSDVAAGSYIVRISTSQVLKIVK